MIGNECSGAWVVMGNGCKLPNSSNTRSLDGVVNVIQDKSLCHEVPFLNDDANR